MYKPPETIGGNYHDGFGYKNSDVFLVAAITAFQLCKLKSGKYFYDYEENDLINKVKKRLDSNDPC